MFNMNGLNESGNYIQFGFGSFRLPDDDDKWESRLAELDEETQNAVRRHMGEFHTDEEMEMFINQYQKGELKS